MEVRGDDVMVNCGVRRGGDWEGRAGGEYLPLRHQDQAREVLFLLHLGDGEVVVVVAGDEHQQEEAEGLRRMPLIKMCENVGIV